MMFEDICTVNNCGDLKQRGDSLFCGKHRITWRDVCKLNGVEFIDIFVTDTELLLKEFKEG